MTEPVQPFFRPERTLINAFGIIILTSLFYFFGAMLRLIDELSLFWPLNAVMAGVFARYAFLNRPHYYLLSYAAMLVYDAITTNWGVASLAINLSNMVFIVTFAMLMQRDASQVKGDERPPLNVLKLFLYCLIAWRCARWWERWRLSASINTNCGRCLPTGSASSSQPGC